MTQLDCHDVAMMDAMIERYEEMAGLDEEMTLQAKKDRLQYGAKYLSFVKGQQFFHPLKIIRFGVDVCGLSMRQATHAVKNLMLDSKMQGYEDGDNPSELALGLYDATDDIFEAVALARFFEWVYRETEFHFWGDVRECLIDLVIPADGEGGQEAAE